MVPIVCLPTPGHPDPALDSDLPDAEVSIHEVSIKNQTVAEPNKHKNKYVAHFLSPQFVFARAAHGQQRTHREPVIEGIELHHQSHDRHDEDVRDVGVLGANVHNGLLHGYLGVGQNSTTRGPQVLVHVATYQGSI